MLYLVSLLVAGAVALTVFSLVQMIPTRAPAIDRRLAELERMGADAPFSAGARRRRQERREQWQALLEQVGQHADADSANARDVHTRLVYAGLRKPGALRMYLGARLVLPVVLGAAGLLLVGLLTPRPALAVLFGFTPGALLGFLAPSFYLDSRVKARQKELVRALPDALDLMVVCVEAGLGLNQALLRVADEIAHVSTAMSEELGVTNLEIRAGTPREDALRHLGERSGVEDLRTLAVMMIQTDRFGTSIAQALRVHADTLRVKRRQRAEEAAAKTAIKMLFPLVLFIFPSLFIWILGPAAIQIYRVLIQGDVSAP